MGQGTNKVINVFEERFNVKKFVVNHRLKVMAVNKQLLQQWLLLWFQLYTLSQRKTPHLALSIYLRT